MTTTTERVSVRAYECTPATGRGAGFAFKRWALFRLERMMDMDQPNTLYMTRFKIIATPWGGLYLHRIHRPDGDRALHDHPWAFTTIVLRGGYVEQLPNYDEVSVQRYWSRWTRHKLKATDAHRITMVRPHTLTLVVVGKNSRIWGFYGPRGWVPWYDYYLEQRPSEKKLVDALDGVSTQH